MGTRIRCLRRSRGCWAILHLSGPASSILSALVRGESLSVRTAALSGGDHGGLVRARSAARAAENRALLGHGAGGRRGIGCTAQPRCRSERRKSGILSQWHRGGVACEARSHTAGARPLDWVGAAVLVPLGVLSNVSMSNRGGRGALRLRAAECATAGA